MERGQTDTLTRLVLCVAAAWALLTAAERLCPGRNISLWEEYGPWITDNRPLAVALIAAGLYTASLSLWPDEPKQEDGYIPCP